MLLVLGYVSDERIGMLTPERSDGRRGTQAVTEQVGAHENDLSHRNTAVC